MTDFYVYIFTDPRRDDQPFYVGKGRNDRWKRHFSENYRNTTNRRKWCRIASIKKNNLTVGVVIIENAMTEEAAA